MSTWPLLLVIERPDGGRLVQACPSAEFFARSIEQLSTLVPLDSTWYCRAGSSSRD